MQSSVFSWTIKEANGLNKPFHLGKLVLWSPSGPEAHLSCTWISHYKSQSILHGARTAEDDTCIPRALPSQGLYIQSLFLLKSSERHMTSHGLGTEGLVYGGSESVNEMFCFFIFMSAFLWLSLSQVLSSPKDRRRHLMRPLMICKLVHRPVTLSLMATSFNIVLKPKELENWMLRLYWSTFHTWIKKQESCVKGRDTDGPWSVMCGTEGRLSWRAELDSQQARFNN